MNGSISPDPMRDIHNFRYSEITQNRDINNRDCILFISLLKKNVFDQTSRHSKVAVRKSLVRRQLMITTQQTKSQMSESFKISSRYTSVDITDQHMELPCIFNN